MRLDWCFGLIVKFLRHDQKWDITANSKTSLKIKSKAKIPR